MTQNRNKLIDLLIGNISNAIVHSILEIAIGKNEIADRYRKEMITSRCIAEKYRNMINPASSPLQTKDVEHIKTKITNKVNSELRLRISKGYQNISLELVSPLVDKSLKELKVVEDK